MAVAIWFVIAARMDTIVDKFGIVYRVTRTPLGAGAVAYYVHAGTIPVARAVLRREGIISDVLVHRKEDRKRRIASALYDLIEADLGRPLQPNRMRTGAAIRALWASRRRKWGCQ
jgi:hypothetical protein